MTKGPFVLGLCLGLSFVGGCATDHDGDRDSGPPLPGPDTGADAGNVTIARDSGWDSGVTPENQLDLLLMIDNSNSMTEEQASVATEIPRMVARMASGDRDGNGTQDFLPPASIHIGIVDSDMGLGNTMGIASCNPGTGDDGLMQIVPRHPAAGCAMSYQAQYPNNVFTFAMPGSATAFANDVACVAQLGTDGCGFEFELESPLKAISLTPSADGSSPVAWTRPGYRPPGFWPDENENYGHGSDPATNGAFLRGGSVLAIVTVNDEDDCSTDRQEIFMIVDPFDGNSNLNLRCHLHADLLYPPSRYADGFLGLRADPSRLVYAAITGVPPAVAGQDPSVILRDPAMIEQLDPARPDALLPSCVSPGGRGVAYPAIRMTSLAQELQARGASVTVQSICTTDFGPAFDAIIDRIGGAF